MWNAPGVFLHLGTQSADPEMSSSTPVLLVIAAGCLMSQACFAVPSPDPPPPQDQDDQDGLGGALAAHAATVKEVSKVLAGWDEMGWELGGVVLKILADLASASYKEDLVLYC